MSLLSNNKLIRNTMQLVKLLCSITVTSLIVLTLSSLAIFLLLLVLQLLELLVQHIQAS